MLTTHDAKSADAPQVAWGELFVALARRPLLWTSAMHQVFVLARPGWWHRAPFLPVPDRQYMAFRIFTAYGEQKTPASADDVIAYLQWCQRERARASQRQAIYAATYSTDVAPVYRPERAVGSTMSRALVLNATFEPLCVVSSKRALVLVLGEKAETLHHGDNVFRSEFLEIVEPSVVRLSHYVHVPHKAHMALNRRAIFARDAYKCQYCNASAENIDHIIPRSRGGRHVWDNVVAACRRCNAAKKDHLLNETSLRLHRPPAAPHSRAGILLLSDSVRPEWREYLESPRSLTA